ncbi:unannotated protein [freshwater metagenome]|uniref:Unannotated protein n=1 Tax=freshwater metagenome TaxID=449393 RepID=A0A6J6LZ22_9ZZZZ
MSRILSRISMLTGQISSQALQVVQAQTSSEVMRSNTELARTEIPSTTPTGGEVCGDAVAFITSPTLRTISRGSSGLPVACAGQTEVQRPQTVHASVSKSCFHVKSSIVTAPKDSSSVSRRLGIGFIAPLGRSLSFQNMFIGLVIMWRSIVVGRITRNEKNAMTCAIHAQRCASMSAVSRHVLTRPESAHPTKDHFSKSGRPSAAMRKPSARKPVTEITRKTLRITRCSGFVLMRIRYGR